MKIENRNDAANVNPHLRRIQDPAEQAESKGSGATRDTSVDRVELSKEAKTLQQTRQLLTNLPDVRSERVEELKPLIQRGVYNVSGMAVAAKMLGQGLVDQLI